MTITQQLNRAREVGTPLVAVATADQPATASAIAREVLDLESKKSEVAPVIGWDILRGYHSMNKPGDKALAQMLGEIPPEATRNLGTALILAGSVPKFSVIVLKNAQRLIEEPVMAQGLLNLRDEFKSNGRMLILIGPAFAHLPAEIGQDMLVLDEPLPTREELRGSTAKLYEDNEVSTNAAVLEHSADALVGLAPFPAESAASLAVSDAGEVEIGEMWKRKFRAIENVKGLTMSLPKRGFDHMGGCLEFVRYVEEYGAGPCRPRLIIWLDEFEKMIGGAGGGTGANESSGTSSDQVKVLLTDMERYGWVGDLRVGPPGCTKSLSVELMAGHLGIPLGELDLGAAKSKWVGESEAQIRACIKAILAMGGEGPGVYFAATCNSLEALSAPLRRRFSAPGSTPFFFDLPDEDELEAIGKVQLAYWETLARRPLAKDRGYFRNCKGWSGANVRDCCRVAYARGKMVEDVMIVPAAQQDKAGLERLRTMANGVFLSASYEGTYQMRKESDAPEALAGRRFASKQN